MKHRLVSNCKYILEEFISYNLTYEIFTEDR